MSTEKVVRYTAEQIRLFINYGESWVDGKSAGQIKAEILEQAARTESDVAGLVESLESMLVIAASTNCLDRIDRDEINKASALLARFQQ